MAKTKIYGASDDLIEIDGDVCDEHGEYDATNLKFSCSDNTQGLITYDGDGQWKINVTVEGDKFLGKVHSVGDDAEHIFPDAVGCSSYSDVIILDEGIEWVKIGRKKYKK